MDFLPQKGKNTLGPLILAAVVGAILLARHASPPSETPEVADGTVPAVELCTVERCVDGDTLIVHSAAGRERVRFIGSDTPETVKEGTPVERFGPEASAHTAKRVAEFGNKVTLVTDGDARDRFGRRLALVRLGDSEILLNEELLRLGLARAKLQFRYSQAMKDRFRAAENEAKSKHLGIWSEGAE